MADFTTTTNLNLKKPAVGGSSDKWGEYLNSDLDTIDTEIQSLKTASTSRSLESLSNVLDTTPTTGQLLQYGTASWRAATVTIPEDIEDLGNVTVSSPADGQVLAYSASNSRWENQTAGAATIPDGTITTAKLSTSLQGQVNLILQTTGTPTDDQILRYNASTTNWEFQDLPGGTISALSDTDVSGISNKDVLVYNSTSGDWVSRPLTIADVTGLQTELDAKLESSDLSVSSLTDTTITTTADNSVLVYDASDSKWKNKGPSTARTSLGLTIGTDVQAYDADTTKNDVSNTFVANQIISVADNINAALRITQTGTGNALVVEDAANPDSTPFVVDGSGRVILGGTATQSLISENNYFQVQQYDQGYAYTAIRYTDDDNPSAILLSKSRGIAAGDNTLVNAEDQIGNVIFAAADGTGVIRGAQIGAAVDGTPDTNDMPGRLVFSTTASGASTPTERMRIDSAGNVGIGTNSPAQKLDVSGNINATGALTLGTALAIAEGGTGATTASEARTSLGLGALATQNTITESQISDLQSYITASSTDTLTNKSGAISQWTNDSGYLTAETNDLSSAVTGTLPIANGGTSATTAAGARTALGLEIGVDVQEYNPFYTKNNVSNTFTANQIISANSSTNAALRITQAGSGNVLLVEDQTNPDSTPFVIDTFGRVGIGTSTLTEFINIEKSYNPAIRLRDTQVADTYHLLQASSNSLVLVGDAGNDYATSSVLVRIGDTTKISFHKTNGIVLYDDIVVNGNSIVSSSGGDINITPDTTGKIVLDGLSWPTSDGFADQVLKTDGAGNLSFVDPVSGSGSGTVTSVAISGTDGIEIDSGSPITTSGTIALGINAATLSSHLSLGTAATTASTDYATAAQGSLADSAVQPADNANILGSGSATDGYVLTADGAGGAAWEAASGGGGGTTAYVEHSSTISDSFTVSSGTNRMYIGGTTFSGTITVAGRLAIVAGPANFTGTINTTGTLAIME